MEAKTKLKEKESKDHASQLAQEARSGGGMQFAVDPELEERARNGFVPWEHLYQAQVTPPLLTEEDLKFIRMYDKKEKEKQDMLWEEHGDSLAQVLMRLLSRVSNAEHLHYIVTMTHDAISDEMDSAQRIANFHTVEEKGYPYAPFIRLLDRGSEFMALQASRVMNLLLLKRDGVPLEGEEQEKYFRWIMQCLKDTKNVRLAFAGLQSLSIVLRNPALRGLWATSNVLARLVIVGRSYTRMTHMTYYTVLCLWLLSFEPYAVDAFTLVPGLVAYVANILREGAREKVIRVSIALLRNVASAKQNAEAMVDLKVHVYVEHLSRRTWKDAEELEDDLEKLGQYLEGSVVILSSFERYMKELLTGELDWSPVHKSEKFWRMNAVAFERDNYLALRLLVAVLINPDSTPLSLSVACHDVGEFVKFHPRGKDVLEELGSKSGPDGDTRIKVRVMALMNHEHKEVSRNALLATQRMLVGNWAFAGAGK